MTALQPTRRARTCAVTVTLPGAVSASSSATVTVRLAATAVYSLSVAVLAVWVRATDSAVASGSSAARAVTDWGVFQVVVVKVRVFWMPFAGSPSVSSRVTAAASALVRVTVTVCVGWAARRTVYAFAAFVAWPSVRARGPASSMAGVAGFASMTRPGASSSVTVAVRVAARLVYSLMAAVLAAWVMTTVSFTPSLSWAAVRVTGWAVSQVDAVKVRVFCVPAPGWVSATVTAVVSALVMVTVTSALGSVARRTV